MEPQEKPQKPNQHLMTDGSLQLKKSEADLESHVMEAWHAELQEEREMLEATPPEDLFTIPTQMVPDQSVLISVADEQRGRLPKWGRTRDADTEETYYAPMCTMVKDDSYGLDSDETGRYVELC
eukprot:8490086-Pyramimonas_sp.AAC.1